MGNTYGMIKDYFYPPLLKKEELTLEYVNKLMNDWHDRYYREQTRIKFAEQYETDRNYQDSEIR